MKNKFFGIVILAILAVFFLTAVPHVYADDDSVTWEFVKVEKNPFCEKGPTDPNALYEYNMTSKGSGWVVSSGIHYEEIKYLLEYFGVNAPEELTGKKFRSCKTDSFFAINYLIVTQKHGGNYQPPTNAELYERTALAMSKMECPDFSDVDDGTVFSTFYAVWDGFSAKKEWLEDLKNRIAELSDNKVRLVDGDRKKFPALVRGPAEYLMLTNGKASIMIIMGPYSTPVQFLN